jgi:hypothetical protein
MLRERPEISPCCASGEAQEEDDASPDEDDRTVTEV